MFVSYISTIQRVSIRILKLRLFRFVWKCVISSVPLRNKRLYRPVTMKLPYASEKKQILAIFTGKHIKYLMSGGSGHI